jgi:hypothetical protein
MNISFTVLEVCPLKMGAVMAVIVIFKLCTFARGITLK